MHDTTQPPATKRKNVGRKRYKCESISSYKKHDCNAWENETT
jgi:hypothetical protein